LLEYSSMRSLGRRQFLKLAAGAAAVPLAPAAARLAPDHALTTLGAHA
jgi:hypothetical protein